MSTEAEEFGAFSVSLGVSDLPKSLEFYSRIGFEKVDGHDGWAMMKKGTVKIGLFSFFKTGPSSLTFNPKNVRKIVADLKAKGIHFRDEPKGDTGPGCAIALDPDQNHIMWDQH